MQSLRSSIRRVPTQLNHINKTNISSRNMSLFPRFTQEFAPIFRLMDEYDRNAFKHFNNHAAQLRSFTPKFDVKELSESYELHGEFPGIKQEDINIEWTDANTLTVSGRNEIVREEGERPQAFLEEGGHGSAKAVKDKEHQPTVEDEADSSAAAETQVTKKSAGEVQKASDAPKYWVSERSVGEFHRSFSFPTRVDQDAVKASLKNGILSIVVPKAKAREPRKISIEN